MAKRNNPRVFTSSCAHATSGKDRHGLDLSVHFAQASCLSDMVSVRVQMIVSSIHMSFVRYQSLYSPSNVYCSIALDTHQYGKHHQTIPKLVKSNLGRFLHLSRILIERAVSIMRLLLDRCAKLQQIVGNRLVRSLEDINQRASEPLFMLGEERDRLAGLACAPCPSDAVDVVFDLQVVVSNV